LRCGVRPAYERVRSGGTVGKPRFTGPDGVCNRADKVSDGAHDVGDASGDAVGDLVVAVIHFERIGFMLRSDRR
jgi:hypothetical protein